MTKYKIKQTLGEKMLATLTERLNWKFQRILGEDLKFFAKELSDTVFDILNISRTEQDMSYSLEFQKNLVISTVHIT